MIHTQCGCDVVIVRGERQRAASSEQRGCLQPTLQHTAYSSTAPGSPGGQPAPSTQPRLAACCLLAARPIPAPAAQTRHAPTPVASPATLALALSPRSLSAIRAAATRLLALDVLAPIFSAASSRHLPAICARCVLFSPARSRSQPVPPLSRCGAAAARSLSFLLAGAPTLLSSRCVSAEPTASKLALSVYITHCPCRTHFLFFRSGQGQGNHNNQQLALYTL